MGFVPVQDEQANAGGFTPIAPEPDPAAERRTVFGDIAKVKIPGIEATFQDALGLLEQPGATIAGAIQETLAGGGALLESMRTRVPNSAFERKENAGLSFPEVFSNEYQRIKGDMPEYVPLTPSGAQMTEKMGSVIEAGLHAYGDAAYDLGRVPSNLADLGELIARRKQGTSAASPAAGALAQAGGTLAMMAIPVPFLGKKGKPSFPDAAAAFEHDFPGSAMAYEGSQVGKMTNLRVGSEKVNIGYQTVIQAAEKALDLDLGEAATMGNLGDKMHAVIRKYAPELSNSQVTEVANAYTARLQFLQGIQDKVVAARPRLPTAVESRGFTPLERSAAVEGEYIPAQKLGPEAILSSETKPALPAPGKTTGETITVDQSGKAYTGPVRRGMEAFQDEEMRRYAAWISEGEAMAGKPLFKKQGGAIDMEGLDEALYAHNNAALAMISVGVPVPIKAFHGTQAEFGPGEYKPGRGIGPHFGSLEQAHEFSGYRGPAVNDLPAHVVTSAAERLPPDKSPNIRPVDLHFKSPLRTKDLSWENPLKLAEQLSDPEYTGGKKIFTTDDQYWIKKRSHDRWDDTFAKDNPDLTASEFESPGGGASGISPEMLDSRRLIFQDIITKLKEKGYDSIVYQNLVEGTSKALKTGTNDSYVALYPREQVRYRNTNELGSVDLGEGGAPVESAKKAAGKTWAIGSADQGKKALDVIDSNYSATDKSAAKFSIESIKSARRAIVSHDYDLQGDLKASGELGEQAMLRMNVQSNATMQGRARYDVADKNIFGGVGSSLRDLEKIIRLRRIVQIDKVQGPGTIKHEGSITGPMAEAALRSMETNPRFKELDARAGAYFTEEKGNILRLLEEGLINRTEYEKMINLGYPRSEYLKFIDPIIDGMPASGIPRIRRGNDVSVNMNAKLLLQDSVARVESRIARNKTMNALYELAKAQPENGIVKLPVSKKDPEGWTSFPVMRKGELEKVLMRDDYADQFTGSHSKALNTVLMSVGDTDITLATALRTASASSLLRSTTTTYNPFFPLAGLPMDLFHLWLTKAGKEYSITPPLYAGEIARDLFVTASDAFMRKGRWEQAMREGLGPTFLTHDALTQAPSGRLHGIAHKTRTALAFFGDFQDMWVRLAHRERLIRDGVPPADATAMAVERLNYSRGGAMIKFIDTMIPYTNIAVNAASKVVEAGMEHKAKMVAKLGWLVAGFSAIKLANMMAAPQTDQAISTEDKVRNMIVPFGDEAFVIDTEGNKRYMYATVRIDQMAMPVNAAVVAGLEQAEYGKIPDEITTKAIGQVNPLSRMFPPSVDAIRRYIDNYDPRRDSPIYHGFAVKPEDEVVNMSKPNPTSDLARMVGDATGLSPMRLEKAAGALVNTHNPFLEGAGLGLRALFRAANGEPVLNPREQAASFTENALQFAPGLSSVVKLTTPGTQQMKELQQADQAVGSQKKKAVDGLEELIYSQRELDGGIDNRGLKDYIAAQPPELQKYLVDHAKFTINVDKVLKKYDASDGIPARNWWIYSNRISDQARAQVFYNTWVSAEPEPRQRMMAVANSLQQLGTGYLSESFQREFQKQSQLLGTAQR